MDGKDVVSMQTGHVMSFQIGVTHVHNPHQPTSDPTPTEWIIPVSQYSGRFPSSPSRPQPIPLRSWVNQISITVKKAETVNVNKCLVSKFQWVEPMQFMPAEFLVFNGKLIPNCWLMIFKVTRSSLISSEKSAQGSPTHRLIIWQNHEQLRILPAIGLNSVLAVTVWEDTFNANKYDHFLKHVLLPCMNRYLAMNSVLVCNNPRTHRIPKYWLGKSGQPLLMLLSPVEP
ncbi:hypothetical protein VP01_4206g1 [Puccinia sorghi]|uniref:Uncharacterized protein n=1 Tax=Puccinia sorghi TaxID=27349 RepID=A0A0L6URL3_9BASI|nr:hypothetical protein VP01_4206g1 [Puccinia sorghi]